MITTLKEVTSKAQKEYRCMLCGCKIEVGQAYIRQTNLYDGIVDDFIVSVSAILSCRPFFILIFLLCIKMKHYGFSRKSIWKNLETFP